MDKFNSIEEILDFAIAGELEANRFYMDLAGKMEKPAMRKVFEDFAREELAHKTKLETVKEKGFIPPVEKVADLKIADYLTDVKPDPNMSYKGAIILAMKKEKEAFRLYNELASLAEDEKLKNIFLLLAQEEAKHKLRFEIEYDDILLKEG